MFTKQLVFGIMMISLISLIPITEAATVFYAEGRFTEDGIQWCQEEKPRYEIIGERPWLEQHNFSIEARVCLQLFSDEFWNYEGSDRFQKLIERSAYYTDLEISESEKEAETGIVDPSPVEEKQPSKIPGWVRNIFLWYGQELISEDELLGALEFLINQGILKVSGTNDCQGTALCIKGNVDTIIDGDTIYVDEHKIRLSLTNTPERGESGFFEATEFTASLCPVGSKIIVDQDDLQPYDSFDRVVGKVICGGKNLNAEILENDYGWILTQYCSTSEFAKENWAQKFGC